MTEQEWLACTDPQKMLEFLRGKASDRKLRLFAVACCRRIWPLMTDERSRRAVEVAERLADDMASQIELDLARKEARAAIPTLHPSIDASGGDRTSREAILRIVVTRAAWSAVRVPVSSLHVALRTAWVAEQRDPAWHGEPWLSNLLRELVGNPFRPVFLDPAWLAWNDGTVRRLAQCIYEERAFDRLPILADALEEAGCADADILSHCRGPGPHVRGCWAVDAILGKE
jgi:hypothetical protein